jgi:hypothetical protein
MPRRGARAVLVPLGCQHSSIVPIKARCAVIPASHVHPWYVLSMAVCMNSVIASHAP